MKRPPNNAADILNSLPNILPSRSLALASLFAFLPLQTASAVWITNYTSLTPGVGGSASGVWREVTTANTGAGTDTGFIVNLTSTGEMKSLTDATHPSDINQQTPWRDIQPGEMYNGFTTPILIPLPFFPQVNGDFANIETDGAASSVVTFDFGAQIKDPVLSFTDVDTQTTLEFGQSFTVLTSTSNLTHTGNNIGSDGSIVLGFEEEAAGSIRFTGTFTQLQFTVNNSGPDPQLDDDRTGYVVTTNFAPEAVPEPSTLLSVLAGALFFTFRRKK